MLNQAEKLKTKFGYALADEVYDDKIITIPGLKGRENKEISQKKSSFDHSITDGRNSGLCHVGNPAIRI